MVNVETKLRPYLELGKSYADKVNENSCTSEGTSKTTTELFQSIRAIVKDNANENLVQERERNARASNILSSMVLERRNQRLVKAVTMIR